MKPMGMGNRNEEWEHGMETGNENWQWVTGKRE